MSTAWQQWLGGVNDLLWGVPMLVLILGVGIYLTLGLRGFPLRRIPTGFRLLFRRSRHRSEQGDISAFNALMTSLAATIGNGNIVGVATAITLGGPGALFWMWMTALVGMATKYAETVLAIRYRERNAQGLFCGGPMYYIKNGLGPRWHWLAVLFALFGMCAGFGIGNTIQAHSVAHVLHSGYGLSTWISGAGMTVLTALVILGGIRSIGAVAGRLVPFMAVVYVGAGLSVLAVHAEQIPAVLAMVVADAFTGTAAQGGFAGASIWMAIRFGVARGVFSNEAGLGSAPIAHAAARARDPVQQGLIGMLGTFIDTLVVCSITGLVILCSGLWPLGVDGAALSSQAFESGLPGLGGHVVSFGIVLFAFSTILGWCYYGERCTEFLFGLRAIRLFRLLWVAAVLLGAQMELRQVWLLADILNALMAIPNLIALLLLSPVVFALTRAYRSGRGRVVLEEGA